MAYGIQIGAIPGGGNLQLDTFQPTTMVGFFVAYLKTEGPSTGWNINWSFSGSITGVSFPPGVRVYAVPWAFECTNGFDRYSFNWNEGTKTLSGHIRSNDIWHRSGTAEVMVGIFADYSSCSSGNYGFWTNNNGVASMLNTSYKPLAVTRRSSYNVSAGGNNNNNFLDIHLSEFGKADSTLRWHRGAFFAGTQYNSPFIQRVIINNNRDIILRITPVDSHGLSWLTDARYPDRDYNNQNRGWRRNDSVKLMVCRERTKGVSGWGIALYNTNGQLSCGFDDQPPLICKGSTNVPSYSRKQAYELTSMYPNFNVGPGCDLPIMYTPIAKEDISGRVVTYRGYDQEIVDGRCFYYLDGKTFKPTLVVDEWGPYFNEYGQDMWVYLPGNIGGSYRVGFVEMRDYFNV